MQWQTYSHHMSGPRSRLLLHQHLSMVLEFSTHTNVQRYDLRKSTNTSITMSISFARLLSHLRFIGI